MGDKKDEMNTELSEDEVVDAVADALSSYCPVALKTAPDAIATKPSRFG
jgi:hypothetical protein